MGSYTLDQLLLQCKIERVSECLSKLSWKGVKLQRSLFTKMNKDTLCDSLIFIAETLFSSTGANEEGKDIGDESTSNNELPTQNIEVTNDQDNIHSQSINDPEDDRPICRLFLDNRCPTGIKGQKCIYQHPKQCRKFLQGGRTKHGCQDWKCPLLHPKICNYLYLHGSCYRTGCKERHTKDHQTPKKITEDQDNQSFLWQKQIQEQIDKLAYTTQQIFQALNQSQQRPVPIWNQTLPQQTLQPPLQPGWTYSQ